jgi:2-polyprenyl-3-methyl-5-hydroxy-6-metoxy-1,4-benzoquinol methylase
MHVLTDPKQHEEKEQLYIAVRACEGRIYTDDELLNLPVVPNAHPHSNEWMYRKQSWLRLTAHLKKQFKDKPLDILDIGCGNGWMGHRLHEHGHNVTGIDLNMTELTQAERVFGSSASLQWVYADVFENSFAPKQFDIIVLAASCQYFPDLAKITERLKTFLNKGGQVHLIDSMFYKDKALKAALQRTTEYYAGLGFLQMSAYYHHHTKDAVKLCGYKRLYPSGLSLCAKPEWWVLDC